MSTQLYDMNEKDHLKLERGDSWRSVQVYKCKVCHIITNLWYMGGYPGLGPRLYCPGTKFNEHSKLAEWIKRLQDYKNDGQLINQASSSPDEYEFVSEHIDQMIKVLDYNISYMRERFSRFNDVEGVSEGPPEIIEFDPSGSYYIAKEHLPW